MASELKQQTVPVLTGEVASAAKNYFEPVFNGLLRPHDETLLSRGGSHGIWIYDEIERDCYTYSVLNKRKMSIISREWTLDAASDAPADQEAADGIQQMLLNMPFDQVCLQLLDAILKGFAVGEVMWQPKDNLMVPVNVFGRDQRRFVMDEDYQPKLLTLNHPVYGEPVPDKKFIVHRFGAKDNNPYGLGLGTMLFWPVYFKRQGIQFWLIYADKFGNPTTWGTYPAGATQEQKQALLDAMSAIATDAGVAVPQGMEIKLLEATGSAGARGTYDTLTTFLNDEINIAVLGETMTTVSRTSGGMGSGQATVQNEVRLELTKADADLLSGTLNRTLIAWCTELNYPNATPPLLWWDVSEPDDLIARANRDKALDTIGYRITPDAVKNVYGDDYVFVGRATGPNPIAGGVSLAEQQPLPVAALINHLESRSAAALRPMFDPILQLVEQAQSLEEIRDGLGRMYPTLDSSRLAELMSEAMASAHLQGRAEIQQET